MKSLSVLFIISYAAVYLVIATNTEDNIMTECLQEQGLKNDDVEFLLRPNNNVQPMFNKTLEDKVACAIACAFNTEIKELSILMFLTTILKMDNSTSADLKEEMAHTLNDCQVEAKGDDCKLLQCVKVTRNPFMNLFFTYVV